MKRSGLTLIELLVVLLIVGVVVLMVLPFRRDGREAGRRHACRSNLKVIGLALHNYHEQYGTFPPPYTVDANGQRLHSWRTLILPFMEHQALYQTIDLTKPWNHPANAQAYQTEVQPYVCPSSDLSRQQTFYLAIVGDEFAFAPDRGRSFDEFTDATSSTMMVVEVRPEEAVHWMSPNDLGKLKSMQSQKQLRQHSSGWHVLMADGSVTYADGLYEQQLYELSTIAGHDGPSPNATNQGGY